MAIRIESDFNLVEIRKRIVSLYKAESWYSLPKIISGMSEGDNFELSVQNSVVLWLGRRGKFKGKIEEKENGCVIIGSFNSPMLAVFTPLILILSIVFFMPEYWVKLCILGVVLSILGFLIVKADHTQLTEILEDITKDENNSYS